jgi:hypothetical protein
MEGEEIQGEREGREGLDRIGVLTFSAIFPHVLANLQKTPHSPFLLFFLVSPFL